MRPAPGRAGQSIADPAWELGLTVCTLRYYEREQSGGSRSSATREGNA